MKSKQNNELSPLLDFVGDLTSHLVLEYLFKILAGMAVMDASKRNKNLFHS